MLTTCGEKMDLCATSCKMSLESESSGAFSVGALGLLLCGWCTNQISILDTF